MRCDRVGFVGPANHRCGFPRYACCFRARRRYTSGRWGIRSVSGPLWPACPSSSVLSVLVYRLCPVYRIPSESSVAWLSAITHCAACPRVTGTRWSRRLSACSPRLPAIITGHHASSMIDACRCGFVHARRLSGTHNYTKGQALLCASRCSRIRVPAPVPFREHNEALHAEGALSARHHRFRCLLAIFSCSTISSALRHHNLNNVAASYGRCGHVCT